MNRRISDTIDIEKLLVEVDSMIDVDQPFPELDQTDPGEPEIQAFHEIEIRDGMEVIANFYPPVGAGEPLRLEAVYDSLAHAGVVHGILHPRIQSTVLELNTDRQVHEGVVIARGTPMTEPVPEHWEILVELLNRKTRLDDQALMLDPKEQSPFVMVKKGDLIAVQISAVPGSSGRDVFGHELGLRTPHRALPQPGKNLVMDGGVCKAECDGCFRWSDPIFQVDRVLVVQGVDYGTGHIDFSGDVVIQGEVARGFRIHAEGSVFSSQVIDASEVVSGADVVSTKGIIGQDGATVRAEGKIRAKFLENIILRAVGSIEVKASALNSILQTLDKVIMGEKSLLMGGRVLAQNGIDTFQVGTERGAYAELCCGMDYQALEKVIQARDQTMVLVAKLKEIERQKLLHPSMRAALDQAYVKVRDEVTRLNNISKQWVLQIDRREEAQVVVRGTIFPGNSVEICHYTTVVARPLSRVRFFLDKKRGAVAWEPL